MLKNGIWSDLLAQMRRAIKQRSSGEFIIFQYGQAGLSFLTSAFLANVLGIEQFGIYAFGMVFAAIIPSVCGFAMDQTLVRDLIQASNPSKTFLASLLIRISLSALMLFGIAVWISSTADYSTSAIATIYICAFCGVLNTCTPRALFDVRRQMREHSRILFVERLVHGSVLLVVYTAGVAVTPVLAALLMSGVRLFGASWEWKSVYRNVDWFAVGNVGRDISYLFLENIPIWLAGLGNMMMTHGSRVMLQVQGGVVETAYFAVALQLIMVVQLLQGQIVRLAAPEIAEITWTSTKAEVRAQLLKRIKMNLTITLCVLLPTFFAAKLVIRYFYDPEYAGAQGALFVLLLWTIIYGVSLIANHFLLGLRLHRQYLVVTTLAGLFSLFLGWLLIPSFGATGAAWALLVGHGCSMVGQLFLVWVKTESK